jgi:alpha-L-rhamnosidase
MLKPVNLRCEYLANPIGVDALEPRLSWELESARPAARGERQTAWQISVRRDGGPTVWSSGKVASGETTHIAYSGKPLVACARYVWKVRVRDGSVSGWSEEATWTMGPRGPWWAVKQADAEMPSPLMAWAGLPLQETWNELEGEPSQMLRREFTLDRPVRRAVLFASALGVYEARLNGSKVGDHVLAPEWTDYRHRVQYQGYDVTGMLLQGKNALGAILGPGWFAGQIGLGGYFLDVRAERFIL